jgi:streptomycin 6-kinase
MSAEASMTPRSPIPLELRTRIDQLVRTWKVTVEQQIETDSSVLVSGTRGGQPVVLKVVKRISDEWHSGEVLEAFGGHGIVRVYEHLEGAVLMERAVPGESLVAMAVGGKDEQATAVAADVIQAMSRSTPPQRCATVVDWGAGFERYVATGDHQIPADLVAEGDRCYAQLGASQGEPRLLHGDLHHYNMVSAGRRGWLAIDPKGVIGEVEYEIGALLRNPIEHPDLFTSPRTIERRLRCFARTLDLDVERALRWAFAQAVLSAIWEIEDGFAVDPGHSALLLASNLRVMLATG